MTTPAESQWRRSDKFDLPSVALADRHYNRQKPGTSQFVRPARSLVLRSSDGGALWVSIWPEFVQHAWPGSWECQIFRREHGDVVASEMIRHAVAHTCAEFGDAPATGMVTFIDPEKVRHKRDPGRCFLRAGFRKVGVTRRRKLIVLQMLPSSMPEPCAVPRDQLSFAGMPS